MTAMTVWKPVGASCRRRSVAERARDSVMPDIPGRLRLRTVRATWAGRGEAVRALTLDDSRVHGFVPGQPEARTRGGLGARARNAVVSDDIRAADGAPRPIRAVDIEPAVARDHIPLDRVVARGGAGVAAEVHTAEVVDHQIATREGHLCIRRE